jgi:tRNA-specific adenosine deaminase 3
MYHAPQLPIASYVPAPPEEPALPSYLARDTRVSSVHPLRHAVLNVVRALSDSTTATAATAAPAPSLSLSAFDAPGPSTSPSPTAEATTAVTAKNGQHYLLTSRTLFTTHEPCVMCSMALLHSRVKEVFFLIPMERTGGCGGAVCVPSLEGVNHRFAIGRWKVGAGGVSGHGLEVEEDIDS